MEIKFSIGLPAVKSVFLEDSIKSVLNQSYKNFELIIFNNGAQEEIKKIVDYFKDDRIKYYESECEGIIKDWNKCLYKAKGDYFALFSDDDLYDENFLLEIYNLIKKYPNAPLFKVRTRIINHKGQTINISSSLAEYETPADFVWHRIKNNRLQYAGDFVAKTEALKKIGGFFDFPDAWCSDDATWFTLANESGIVCTNKLLFNYRVSQFTVSNSGKLEKKIDAINHFYDWLKNDFLKKINLIEKNDMEILNLILANLNKRKTINLANTLFSNTRHDYLKYIDVIFQWIRFSQKMNYDIYALFYALAQKKVNKSYATK